MSIKIKKKILFSFCSDNKSIKNYDKYIYYYNFCIFKSLNLKY